MSAEDVVLVYDLRDGSKGKSIECKKYGVNCLEYLDTVKCVHSGPNDTTIRLLHLQKKSYVRYFDGHRMPVNFIRTNPKDREKFLSSSVDGEIRMFDTRTFENYGCLLAGHTPLIAFDPDGILFAVATKSDTIKLFDMRSFDLGPFQSFIITKTDNDEWSDIEFSPCGKFILISTTAGSVKWIDAFDGTLIHSFSQHKNPNKIPLRASVSTDSGFVMVGSADRNVYIYSTETGGVTCKLPTPYPEPSHVVAFNQKQFLMTSLGREVILWAPSEEYTQNL